MNLNFPREQQNQNLNISAAGAELSNEAQSPP